MYESDWVNVDLYDVTLPDGSKIEHHIVRCGVGGAGVVVHDADKGILLIYRHRITSDMWGWELPGGRIEEGEKPEEAAAREVLEETGWRPNALQPLLFTQPMNGIADHPYHFFYAEGATWERTAIDPNEAADLAWVPVDKVKELMQKGEMNDGFSLNPLLWAFTFGPLNNL